MLFATTAPASPSPPPLIVDPLGIAGPSAPVSLCDRSRLDAKRIQQKATGKDPLELLVALPHPQAEQSSTGGPLAAYQVKNLFEMQELGSRQSLKTFGTIPHPILHNTNGPRPSAGHRTSIRTSLLSPSTTT
ncbi:hypothetical protein FA13DRAFT_1796559 [Coprinellus micaceus]|uniref:Uncharacterized protein n=1 Tax=Coprinellus micaceus TaxID=71717 RepID=A0A4Y7STT0_COPMI|nr:hypothetical protein FA13DRAFT_1796559 [Coprinellus micaceus]